MSAPTARQRRIAALRVLAATGEYGLPPAQLAENIPAYPAATIRGLVTNGLVARAPRLVVTAKGAQLLADVDRQAANTESDRADLETMAMMSTELMSQKRRSDV